MERVKGIEPSPKAWEAFVLPLNYTRETHVKLATIGVSDNRGVGFATVQAQWKAARLASIRKRGESWQVQVREQGYLSQTKTFTPKAFALA